MDRAGFEVVTRARGPIRYPNQDAPDNRTMARYAGDTRGWSAHSNVAGDHAGATRSGSTANSNYEPRNPPGQFQSISGPPDGYDAGSAPAGRLAEDHGGASGNPQGVYNYGTWAAADDRTLVLARSRGQNWTDLQRTYFPAKTANACRKRHERLMERRGVQEADADKQHQIASEYVAMRKRMWSPLAERVGESWEFVEEMCMSLGIRNIQTHARSHTNRSRRENRASQRAFEVQMPPAPNGLRLSPQEGPVPMGPNGLPFSPTRVSFGADFGGRESMDVTRSSGDMPPVFPAYHHTDAELMPPPPFVPGIGTPLGSQESCSAPTVSFGGYLNGRSTRWPRGAKKSESRVGEFELHPSTESPRWRSGGRAEPG